MKLLGQIKISFQMTDLRISIEKIKLDERYYEALAEFNRWKHELEHITRVRDAFFNDPEAYLNHHDLIENHFTKLRPLPAITNCDCKAAGIWDYDCPHAFETHNDNIVCTKPEG
jgi:hypothetical protein